MTLLVLFPFRIWTKYSIKIVGQVFSQVVLTRFFLANFFQLAHREIPKCHLIFWCHNFVGTYIFRRVSGDSFETLQTLCVSTNFPQQKIRWNYRILCIEYLLFISILFSILQQMLQHSHSVKGVCVRNFTGPYSDWIRIFTE